MGRNARHRRSYKTDTNGNCYEEAAKVVFATPASDGLLVVHGSASNPFNRARRINHAWVEIPPGVTVECADGTITTDQWMCYDPTTLAKNTLLLPRPLFYDLGAITVDATYSRHDAQIAALTYQHWGPWDGSCPPLKRKG
jgi:hypothetical protein